MTQHRFTYQWLAASLVVGTLLALAACGSTSSTSLPSADSVLTKAEQAPLKDATFSFTFKGEGENLFGTGMLTTALKRTENVYSSSTYPLMELTDSTGYYIKLPTADSTWAKVTVQDIVENYGDDLLLKPEYLDYSQLEKVKVLGSETINGKPTWHLQGRAQSQIQLQSSTRYP
jgi:hypothetical protein